MCFREGMNTDEEQIDFGLEHLSDCAEGEFEPADYPGAPSFQKYLKYLFPAAERLR